MTAQETDIQHLLDECRTVEENCLYTAQAHYTIAQRENVKKWVLIVSPAFLSGLAGALVACGLPAWIGIIGAVLGGVGGVAAALGVDRDAIQHMTAGHILTSLRHEARQIHEVFFREHTRPELVAEVRRLDDKYNNVRLALPCTDDAAFEKAREKIRKGRFVPDFKEQKPAGSAPAEEKKA